MNFSLCIVFRGNCAEAVAFYSDVFGTTPIEYITFSDKKNIFGDVPETKSHFIYRAVLDIPGNPGLRLVLGDTPALLFQDDTGSLLDIAVSQHTTVEINNTDPDVIRSLYDKLMRKGKSNKVLGEAPPYKLSGSLIDDYGICWDMYCI